MNKNSPVVFLHDKRLVNQYKSTFRLLFFVISLQVVFGIPIFFILHATGISFLVYMLPVVSTFFLIMLHAQCKKILSVIEFFQDDYIKNHPELPKDDKMLER